jgi:hypothetical protein
VHQNGYRTSCFATSECRFWNSIREFYDSRRECLRLRSRKVSYIPKVVFTTCVIHGAWLNVAGTVHYLETGKKKAFATTGTATGIVPVGTVLIITAATNTAADQTTGCDCGGTEAR